MQQPGPSLLTSLAIYVVVAALLVFRYSRPQKMSVTRLFVAPIFLIGMTALSVWGNQQLAPVPWPIVALSLVVGFALGVPPGILRGRHTSVRATERPGVMYLDASWIVLVVWIGAFVLRAVIRALMPHGIVASAVGDGLIAFAIGMVVVSYVAIYRKYRALEHAAGQI